MTDINMSFTVGSKLLGADLSTLPNGSLVSTYEYDVNDVTGEFENMTGSVAVVTERGLVAVNYPLSGKSVPSDVQEGFIPYEDVHPDYLWRVERVGEWTADFIDSTQKNSVGWWRVQ